VGAPVDEDYADSHSYVREGADGVVTEADSDGTSRVDFCGTESALLPFGSKPWWVDNRRLTLVDEKHAAPAAPMPDNGPAFPDGTGCGTGMTLRQYAAIKLCVPESGLPWLDEMIRKSLKDRFAGQALEGVTQGWFTSPGSTVACIEIANDLATAMMERRAK
jgi:hypothetical protein